MASFRKYVKKNGEITINVEIRKKGFPALYQAFSGMDEKIVKADAKAWAQETEARMYYKRFNDPRAADFSLGDAFRKYFIHAERTKSVKTVRRERDAEKQILDGIGHDMQFNKITKRIVAEYRDVRLDSYVIKRYLKDGKIISALMKDAEGRPKKVSGTTVRRELSLLSALFNLAIKEWEYNLENPCVDIWKPKENKAREKFLEINEINRFLEECRKSSNELLPAYVLIRLQTGMRPGEAAALRVSEINRKTRSVRVLGKNGDHRSIPLTDASYKEVAKLMIGKKPEDYLFFGETIPKTYETLPSERFKRTFDRAKKRAGLKWLTQHDLRHTAASHMIMRGVDLRVIAEILGHRTLQMAMRYSHLNDETVRQAVTKIGDLGISV